MKRAMCNLGVLVVSAIMVMMGAAGDAFSQQPVPVKWAADERPMRVILTGTQCPTPIRKAVDDLQDCLTGIFANGPSEPFSQSGEHLPRNGQAILVGTPESFPLVTRYVSPDRLKKPESFVVTTAREGNCELAIIAGADARGVAYGVYALLEKLGYGFYLSYDAAPEARNPISSFEGWELADAPLVPHRVVFNWHNFLSGCSTWSLEHWKKWIVQSQKMGYNAVMVHAYGNNPMVEFEFGGQKKPVGYLSTTRSGRDWSTMHVNDVRRLWGGQVFDAPVFGSEAAMAPEAQRVDAVQKMMRDAFQCAKDHAMGVYFAFDMETFQANPQNVIMTLPESARFLVPSNSGPEKLWLANPDTPEGYEYYKAQVAAMLKAYPQITTLVCWFRWGAGTPWMRMTLENMPPAWQAEYKAEIARTPEAAKLELPEGCFALSKAVKAYARALKDLGRPEIQVATGTWRFLFYPACDRFMPREVMFIGLDYDVLHGHSCFEEPQQRAQQAAVGAHRAIVPIAWAHHDDGNYLGRSYTPYDNFHDKLAEMKASGYGIIHWTTRPLDLYFKSLVRQVWQSTKNQSLREGCAQMAARTFGETAREKGGEYLYQWVTTAPLFTRETSPTFVDRKLSDPTTVSLACQARLKILDGIDRAQLARRGGEWLEYFRGLEQFIMDVHRNEAAYRKIPELLNGGDREAASRELAACDPESVIERYARFSSLAGMSRGEQGTVVSMNTRWLPHYVSLRQALGMEPVHFNYGPTQHDPLAQSAGKYTFFFGLHREIWETLGNEETGAEAFALPENIKLAASQDLPADYTEICRSGIESAKPLTLALRPIIQRGGRGAAAQLPAGNYRLTLLLADAASKAEGERVFDVQVAPQAGQGSGGMEWYAFKPVSAKFLRLACRGNNQNLWNSIIEVKLDTLARGRNAATASGAKAGYPAQAAIDGDEKTRWAIEGTEHWIQFALDPGQPTGRIGIEWFGGEQRRAKFEIQVSQDGKTWEPVAAQAGGTGETPSGSQSVADRIDIFKETGAAGQVLLKQYTVKLDRPGAVDLTLTPVAGKAILCGAVLAPAN